MKMMLHFFVIEVANNGNTKQVASVGICKRIEILYPQFLF